MTAGKEDWKKQGDLGHKVKKDIDWDIVRTLNMVNRQLQVKGRHDMKHTADFLRATFNEMEEEREEHQNTADKWVIPIVNGVLATKNSGDYTALGSMIKALAETYSTLSDEYISLTEERCDELKIPSFEKNSFEENNLKNLYYMQLDVVLGNKHGSMNIINDTYKTQRKTPCSLPSGVPTGRGRP